jgi:hypothetical protein
MERNSQGAFMAHDIGWAAALIMVLAVGIVQAQPQDGSAGAGIAILPGDNGSVIIQRVLENGPAAQAGIRPGDVLLAVEGRDVRAMDFEQIPHLIRGPAGSRVTLIVVTPGQQPRQAVVTRGGVPARIPPNEQPQQPVGPDPGPPRGPQPAPQGVRKFVRVSFHDPAANNVEAWIMLIPSGWQMQGRIAWLHEYTVLANAAVRVRDPQSGAELEWLPVQNFVFMPQPPMPMQPFQNYNGQLWLQPIADGPQFAQVFWMGNSLQHLRQARLVRQEEVPALAAEFIRQFRGPAEARAFRLRYEYQNNGQPWEEEVTFALLYSGNQFATHWQVNYATTRRAPRGMLDRLTPEMNAMVASATTTPMWDATLQICRQLMRQGLMQQIRDNAAFSAQLAQYREHTFNLSQQIHQERMTSMDQRAETFREVLGGIETYKDPYKHELIQLPQGFKKYWVNRQGEYILSDVEGYNPNVGSTDDWRDMQRRDPMNPATHGGF